MLSSRIIARTAPLALAALMGLSGCLSTRTASPTAEQFDSLGLSLAGIRQSNLRTAYLFSLEIEKAADSIIQSTQNRTTKTRAHLWRIYSIPVIRQVYSHSDPITASLDALVFAMQCEEYFDTGIGHDRFGDQQLIAVKTSADIQASMIEGLRRNLTVADFDTLLTRLDLWVHEHPLTNHVFGRASIARDMDKFLARRDQSIGSAIGRIADDVDDLSAHLALFSAQLPREARWQGEYLLSELEVEDRLNSLDTTIAILNSSLAHIEETLTGGEITLDIVALRSLHADVVAALELVRAERTVLLADVERQRLETLSRVDAIAHEKIKLATEEVEGIVNRLLWKVGVLLALALLGVGLLMLLGRALWRGPSRAA